jgi:hypothetical protein
VALDGRQTSASKDLGCNFPKQNLKASGGHLRTPLGDKITVVPEKQEQYFRHQEGRNIPL